MLRRCSVLIYVFALMDGIKRDGRELYTSGQRRSCQCRAERESLLVVI